MIFFENRHPPPELGRSRVPALIHGANRKHPICGAQARGQAFSGSRCSCRCL